MKWLLWPREYKPSKAPLDVADWTKDPYIWLHYVESSDGILPDDDVLRSVENHSIGIVMGI